MKLGIVTLALGLLFVVHGCGPSDELYDFDGDGSLDSDDCAPEDPERFPGAEDTVGDGLDNNCDGIDGIDLDGDTYASTESGGDDCNDSESSVHPGADDPPDDIIDQDCDGFLWPTTVHLLPVLPLTSDELYLQVVSDSDEIDVTWFKDGIEYSNSEQIPSSETHKGEAWRVEVVPRNADGVAGVPVDDTVVIQNAPPSADTPTLAPSTGTENTTFTCVPAGWTDIDGDAPGYTWAWSVNGAPTATTETLDGTSFDAGDSIACTATPFDGQDSGIGVDSAAVVIDNALPSVSSVSISPTAGTESTTFTCQPSGWVDPDPGDVEAYLYEWFVGPAGAEVASVTTATIDGTSFDKGDSVYCTATPLDGQSAGSMLASIAVLVDNTVPTATAVSIEPSMAYTDTTLSAVANGWSDPDPADTEDYLYEWFVDGAPAGTDSATLDGSWFVLGEEVTLTATPQDGTASGSPVSSVGVSILNTTPSPPVVAISPAQPTPDDDLVCSITTPASDPDVDDAGQLPLAYDFIWSLGDSPQAMWDETGLDASGTATVDASATLEGDVWYCDASAHDGQTQGTSSVQSVTPVGTAGCSTSGSTAGSCSDSNTDSCDGCEDGELRNTLTLANQQFNFNWNPGLYSTTAATLEAWFLNSDFSGSSTDHLLTTQALDLRIGTSHNSVLDNDGLLPSGQNGGGAYANALGCYGGTTTTGAEVRARSNSKVNSGGWHHLACVFDQGELRIYFDGVLEFSYFPGGELDPPTNSVAVGFNVGAPNQDVEGSVDEVRYSSVARYGADFTPARRHSPDCATVFLWHMDDVPGTTAEDAGPDGHDLTGTNSTDFAADDCYGGLF